MTELRGNGPRTAARVRPSRRSWNARRSIDAQRRVGPFALVRGALSILGPARWWLALLGTLSLVTGFVETAALYVVARMAAALASSEVEISLDIGPLQSDRVSLAQLAIAASVLVAVLLSLAFPVARSSARLGEVALLRVRTRFANAHMRSRWADRSRDSEGHFQLFVSGHARRAERLVLQCNAIVIAGGSLVILGVSSVVIAPAVAALALIGLTTIGAALRPLSQRAKEGARRLEAIDREFAAQVAQTSRVGQEIASFQVTDAVLDKLVREIMRGARQLRQIRFFQRLVPAVYQGVALGVIIAIVSVLVASDSTDASAIGPVLLLMVRALGYAKQLQNAVQAGNELLPYVDVLHHEVDRLAAAEEPEVLHRPDKIDTIRFENVGFEYDAGVPVLSHVDFTIRATDAVALVGPSGAGKSTIVQLLLRLRNPTCGRIMVGGIDLRDLDPRWWARHAAFVPQDNKLILGSVADNIRFYRAGFSDHDVAAAARAAHLEAEIAALPAGYTTMIGPGAQDLSGGQRQRLGIARALLGGPSLLVLDEPTSALDSKSEEMIRRTLEDMRDRVGLVVVAHRQSTLEVCERTLRVQRGRVVEPSAAGAVRLAPTGAGSLDPRV